MCTWAAKPACGEGGEWRACCAHRAGGSKGSARNEDTLSMRSVPFTAASPCTTLSQSCQPSACRRHPASHACLQRAPLTSPLPAATN